MAFCWASGDLISLDSPILSLVYKPTPDAITTKNERITANHLAFFVMKIVYSI